MFFSITEEKIKKWEKDKKAKKLINAKANKDVKIREAAIEALTNLTDTLIQDLSDNNTQIRAEAVNLLGEIGNEKALEPLKAVLKDEKRELREGRAPPIVRARAARVLGELGNTSAIKTLAEALLDDNKLISETSSNALKEIGTPEALNALSVYHKRQMEQQEVFVLAKSATDEALVKLAGMAAEAVRINNFETFGTIRSALKAHVDIRRFTDVIRTHLSITAQEAILNTLSRAETFPEKAAHTPKEEAKEVYTWLVATDKLRDAVRDDILTSAMRMISDKHKVFEEALEQIALKKIPNHISIGKTSSDNFVYSFVDWLKSNGIIFGDIKPLVDKSVFFLMGDADDPATNKSFKWGVFIYLR